MEIEVAPGKYVVAVSGGVDSVVLLDVLRKQPGVRLLVAHFDHGIRPDSVKDRKLVQQLADAYGLPFVYKKGNLGPNASEDVARRARYAFLEEARISMGARAIITAHHEDDVLETAILNILRGTGRRGVTALASTAKIVRPLLHVPKRELLRYAKAHGLTWHEDTTNQDVIYKRNYVRHNLVPKLGTDGRRELLRIIDELRVINAELDHELLDYIESHTREDKLYRKDFIMLPHAVSREVMAMWLRVSGWIGYDRKALERLVVAAKTYRPGKVVDVYKGLQMHIEKDALALRTTDR